MVMVEIPAVQPGPATFLRSDLCLIPTSMIFSIMQMSA
jgi:hypothetical protein